MKESKKYFKKAVSMLITVCLIVGIANIPAYAAVNAVSTAKTTDAILSKTYTTPAAAVKATTTTTTTTKTTTAKATTATNKTAAKAVSLTTQIINKYTKTGLTVLKKLASKVGLKLKTVYNYFVKMGVTKAQIKKVSSGMLNLMKKGENFINCASLAVAKYLGISKSLAAVCNLAGDISVGLSLDSKSSYATGIGMELTLQKIGHKKADSYNVSISNFMSALKVGEKAILSVGCVNTKGQNAQTGHAVTVVKEKNGKYGIYDILVNGGNKVIYTASEFKKFLNGKRATGKTTSGKTIKRPLYYKTTLGYLRYKPLINGVLLVTTDSKGMEKAEIKSSIAYKFAQQSYSLIDKLLKNKNLSSVAKTWLKKAKTVINNILYGKESLGLKKAYLDLAFDCLKRVEKRKVTIASLADVSNFAWFAPLKSVLEKDINYKIYNSYDEDGLQVINEISKKYNLNKADVYNAFLKNGVSKLKLVSVSNIILSDIKNGRDPFVGEWAKSCADIEKSLAAIKQLLDK